MLLVCLLLRSRLSCSSPSIAPFLSILSTAVHCSSSFSSRPCVPLGACVLRTGLHAGASRTSAGEPARSCGCPSWSLAVAPRPALSASAGTRPTSYLLTRSYPLVWPRVVAGAVPLSSAPARECSGSAIQGNATECRGNFNDWCNIWCPASNSTPRACGLISFEDCLWLQVAHGRVSGAFVSRLRRSRFPRAFLGSLPVSLCLSPPGRVLSVHVRWLRSASRSGSRR